MIDLLIIGNFLNCESIMKKVFIRLGQELLFMNLINIYQLLRSIRNRKYLANCIIQIHFNYIKVIYILFEKNCHQRNKNLLFRNKKKNWKMNVFIRCNNIINPSYYTITEVIILQQTDFVKELEIRSSLTFV